MPGDTSFLRGRDQESFLEIDVTGRTALTLSAVQAVYKSIRFTGAPGADFTARLPLSEGSGGVTWTFDNATTGDFTATVTPITGSGVTVGPGQSLTAWYDGVDLLGTGAVATAISSSTGDTFNIAITNIQEGDVLAYDTATSSFVNQQSGGGSTGSGQLVLTVNGNVTLDLEQAAAANIELRAGSVAAPWTLTFPDVDDGRSWIVENQTGQVCTLEGDSGDQTFMVNNSRAGVLWDGTQFSRTWYSTPTHYNLVVTDPYVFTGWAEVDADYIEFTPSGGNVEVRWPNGAALGKRGRRQTVKNDHTSSLVTIKVNGAGGDKSYTLLPGETTSFVIDDSGAIVADWTRSYERRAAVTHDNSATYTVIHPDFLARVLVIGGTLTLKRNLVLPTANHHSWLIVNETGQNLVVKTAGGAGVTVLDSNTEWVACDGTDIVSLGQASSTTPALAQDAFRRLIMGNVTDFLFDGSFCGMILDVQSDQPSLTMRSTGDPFRVDPGVTGTQWGTSVAQLQSWWGADPIAQQPAPTGTDTQKIDGLIAILEDYGLLG